MTRAYHQRCKGLPIPDERFEAVGISFGMMHFSRPDVVDPQVTNLPYTWTLPNAEAFFQAFYAGIRGLPFDEVLSLFIISPESSHFAFIWP